MVHAAFIAQNPANFQQKLADEPAAIILHFYPLKAYDMSASTALMGGEMALRPLRVERVGWTAFPLMLGGVLGTYRPVEVIVGGHPLLTVNQELIRHRQCVELSLKLLMATDVA
jgi:hypothetical protein